MMRGPGNICSGIAEGKCGYQKDRVLSGNRAAGKTEVRD